MYLWFIGDYYYYFVKKNEVAMSTQIDLGSTNIMSFQRSKYVSSILNTVT
jgi:hypothetical protein